MKITSRALRTLVREAVESNKILKERPWSVEYTFKISGGKASDSEGQAADGFAIVMTSKSGRSARVVVDCYWNPQSGDQSGNSLRFETEGREAVSTYVPTKFDNEKQQKIIISNSPVAEIICISHCVDTRSVPVTYLVAPNPFEINDDLEFDVENIGNGEISVKLTDHINL